MDIQKSGCVHTAKAVLAGIVVKNNRQGDLRICIQQLADHDHSSHTGDDRSGYCRNIGGMDAT